MGSQWIVGGTCSGKTQQLIEYAQTVGAEQSQPLLVLAANGDNRILLANRLVESLGDRVATLTATPAGFVQDEVILFWPLLVQQLNLQSHFPLKLRPENEQMLATDLWQPRLTDGSLQVEGWREARMVRRTLDFYQLASQGMVPLEDIAKRLQAGMPPLLAPATLWITVGEALAQWQDWCLHRGFVTYGIMSMLYWRYLLPMPAYQSKLLSRFRGILADDIDEYPALMRPIFEQFLDAERPCGFTTNPNGQIRLGLGADPDAIWTIEHRCEQTIQLDPPLESDSLARWGEPFAQWVEDPLAMPTLPNAVSLLQATSRGQMLRLTAEAIGNAIAQNHITADEIAVIGPGLDAIGRYSLIEILTSKGIRVTSLNDQRPLVSSPMVRALLSLLALIYPGLGRLVNRDAIAEMLVVLSQQLSRASSYLGASANSTESGDSQPWFDLISIDPVRAELIADHCFVADVENPRLLPVEDAFDRWDRLGHQTVLAYRRIRDWLTAQQQLRQQRLTPSPVVTIDRIVQDFLWRGHHLPADQLATLRELMETAQAFWQVEDRLRRVDGPQRRRKLSNPDDAPLSDVGRFVTLIQKGTVSANPYPVTPQSMAQPGVTLSTIYQYRAQRLSHRWQFWLDAGSPLWASSASELFGAPIFLRNWLSRPLTLVEVEAANEAQLGRTLRDLLGRTKERVILSHSDLALTGQEQMGPLLTLVGSAEPIEDALITSEEQTEREINYAG